MKRKINILPIIFCVFILLHFISAGLFFCKEVAIDYIGGNNKRSVLEAFKNESVQILTKNKDLNLYETHKEFYITINGLIQNAVGNNIINDADVSNDVIKLKNGHLTGYSHSDLPEDKILKYTNDVSVFYNYLKEKGIDFLFVQIPSKSNGDLNQFPTIISNHSNKTYAQLAYIFEKNGVDILDLKEKIDEQNLEFYSLYYKTDHHWNSYAGRWAADEIGKKLSSEYNYVINSTNLNSENFVLEKHSNNFLGSWGKRVGPLYAGVDDFDILIPNYNTSFDYQYDDNIKTGSFREALIDDSYLSGNYYHRFSYDAFLSGNHSFITIHNNNSVNDKKILCIVNSYSCALLPYMALSGYKDIYAIDPRINNTSVKYYVEKYNPDMVIFMMNSDLDAVQFIKQQ